MKKKLSFVIPIYNEEKNIPALYEKLIQVITKCSEKYESEVILVDDGSRDNSWSIMQQLAACDDRITAITFSRNFGNQLAITAGYDYAQGDAIIALDADLQDPPELIHEMIRKWEEGFYIVYARRSSRHDGFFKTLTAFVYYKLLHAVAEIPIPQHVGDFRIIDRAVLLQINACRERARYLRGMVAWTGFAHTFVEFDRNNRVAGESGYSWLKLIKFALDGLTNFSLFPLKLAAFIGAFVMVTGSCMFMYITYDILLYGTHYPPFKWLVTALYIFMGIQFFLMWLLGEYIGRMYEQQKNRPLYIVREKVGQVKNNRTAVVIAETTGQDHAQCR